MTTIEKMIKFLALHEHRYFYNKQYTQLFLEDVYKPMGGEWESKWINISKWSFQDLKNHLGY